MSAETKGSARPAWSDDCLDSTTPTAISAPYYDEELQAWVLSRYDDVQAALHASELSRESSDNIAEPEALKKMDLKTRMRAETLEFLSAHRLREWNAQLSPVVHARVSELPTDRTVNLVAGFAVPMGLHLAVIVTHVDRSDAEYLRKLSKPISDAAADPYDAESHLLAVEAEPMLRSHFHACPEFLRDSTFVALAHTIPCMLANAWLALLQHPREWQRLHDEPELVLKGVEELLRYAGLVRLLYRRATDDVKLNGLRVRKGERLILRIIAANRDPDQFEHADAMDLSCRRPGHLALGAGPHSCAGASLIRMAMTVITCPLVERFAGASLAGTVEWKGGSIFRSPATLPVLLRE